MRYCIAKQHRRSNGKYSWGVYDEVQKTFVEGGFFSKAEASKAADEWNRLSNGIQSDGGVS